MAIRKEQDAISEVMGALLLVAVLMTGMALISVVLLSIPPPSSIQKAVLGIKCSWCPDLNRYDILIDHEGGENLSTKDLRFNLYVNNSSITFEPDYIYAPTDPQHLYIPPATCDDSTGLEARQNWADVSYFGTGQSLKYSYSPELIDGFPPLITYLTIQQPASIGYDTIARLKINYIQNLTQFSSIQGAGGLPVQAGTYFVSPSFDRSTLTYSADGCEVDFTYINAGEDQYYGWGSRGNPWNYLEFSDPGTETVTISLADPSVFPHADTPVKVMTISDFIGTVEYRLGYRSAQMTCDQRLIDMWKL